MWLKVCLYILIISAILITIWYYKPSNKENSIGEYIFCLVALELFIGFISFLILGLSYVVVKESCTKTESISYSTKYELKCLKDYMYNDEYSKSELDGKFILTYGYIHGESESGVEHKYITKYIAKDDKGIFRVNQIEDNSKIGFIEDGENVVEVYKSKTWNTLSDSAQWWCGESDEEFDIKWTVDDYVFHIPSNSIITDKEIDLK